MPFPINFLLGAWLEFWRSFNAVLDCLPPQRLVEGGFQFSIANSRQGKD